MAEWELIFSKQALKDAKLLASARLGKQVTKLLDLLKENPYSPYPPYEKLVGNLTGYYSRRINIQHRLLYRILEEEKIVEIIRLWTHYE